MKDIQNLPGGNRPHLFVHGRPVFAFLRNMAPVVEREGAPHDHDVESHRLVQIFGCVDQEFLNFPSASGRTVVTALKHNEIQELDISWNRNRRHLEVTAKYISSVGYSTVVERQEGENVVWYCRRDRVEGALSPFVQRNSLRETRYITIVIRKIAGYIRAPWEIVTRYHGERVPVEIGNLRPFAPNCEDSFSWPESLAFWLTHAFVFIDKEVFLETAQTIDDERMFFQRLFNEYFHIIGE